MMSLIETKRCNLCKMQQGDYADVKQLHMDESVRKYLGGIDDEEKFSEKFHQMNRFDNESFYWIVRLKENGEFIGVASLKLHHDGKNKEVSYEFLPRFWGQGYGTEVIQKVIEYGFNEIGLDEIVAETQTANKTSCKLLEKVGMTLKEKIERFGAEQSIFRIQKTKFR
jgi:[ribosomal protein S5]-alanine N-acetyltransferase